MTDFAVEGVKNTEVFGFELVTVEKSSVLDRQDAVFWKENAALILAEKENTAMQANVVAINFIFPFIEQSDSNPTQF